MQKLKDHTIVLRVTKDQKEKLISIASKDDRSVSSFLRIIINNLIKSKNVSM